MKTTAVLLQALGLFFVTLTALNLFFLWTTNDALWLLGLFVGITLFGIGARIEYANLKYYSRMQFERNMQQMRTARNIALCGILGILFCIVLLIERI